MNNKTIALVMGIALAVGFSFIVFMPAQPISAEVPTQAYAGEKLFDYRIAYFTKDSLDSQDLLSPSNIRQAVGAEIVRTWSEVVRLNTEARLDGLILAENVFSEIDSNELSRIYQEGAVIAAFNTYSPVIAEVIQDRCIMADGWMNGVSEPIDGYFYLIVSRFTSGKPEDIDRIENQTLCSSGDGEIAGVEGEVSILDQKAANSMTDLTEFSQVLLIQIENIRGSGSGPD